MANFDYEGALKEGLTDQEIFEHLKQKHPKYKYDEAQESGLSIKEINQYLSSKESHNAKPKNWEEAYKKRREGKGYFESLGMGLKTQGKRTAKALTLGLSELIPALKMTPEEEAETSYSDSLYDMVQSFGPFDKVFKTISTPVQKGVEAGIKKLGVETGAKALGSVAGAGAAGIGIHGIEKVGKGEGLPGVQESIDTGIMWAGLDAALRIAGKAVPFTKAILNAAKETGQTEEQIKDRILKEIIDSKIDPKDVEKTTEKAFEVLESFKKPEKLGIEVPLIRQADKSLSGRVSHEVEGINLKKAETPGKPSFGKTAQEIAEENALNAERQLKEDLVKFEPFETSEKAGTQIKERVEAARSQARASEKELYDQVERAAERISFNHAASRRAANVTLEDLSRIKTKPEGYSKIENTLRSVLSDIGKGFQNTSQMIELGRRLNDIINYEAIEPHISKRLSGVKNAVKSDIRKALGSKSKELEKLFDKAEALHAKNANIYGNESLLKVRGQDLPEKIAGDLKNPTSLRRLKEATPKEHHKQIERAFLDQLEQASEKRAAIMLREASKNLSREARDLADRIIRGKAKRPILADKSAIRDAVRRELTELAEGGLDPTKTLKMWKTPEGRKLVENIISKSPNGNEIKSYLEAKSLENIISKKIDKAAGKVDRNGLSKLIKDPEVRKEIATAAGKDGLKTLDVLDKAFDKIEKQMVLLDRLPTETQKQMIDKATYGKGKLERIASQRKEKLKADKLAEKEAKESQKAKEKEDILFRKEAEKQATSQAKEEFAKQERDRHPITSMIKDKIKNSGPLGKVIGLGVGLTYHFHLTPAAITYALLYIAENPAVRKAAREVATKDPSAMQVLKFFTALQTVRELNSPRDTR